MLHAVRALNLGQHTNGARPGQACASGQSTVLIEAAVPGRRGSQAHASLQPRRKPQRCTSELLRRRMEHAQLLPHQHLPRFTLQMNMKLHSTHPPAPGSS